MNTSCSSTTAIECEYLDAPPPRPPAQDMAQQRHMQHWIGRRDHRQRVVHARTRVCVGSTVHVMQLRRHDGPRLRRRGGRSRRTRRRCGLRVEAPRRVRRSGPPRPPPGRWRRRTSWTSSAWAAGRPPSCGTPACDARWSPTGRAPRCLRDTQPHPGCPRPDVSAWPCGYWRRFCCVNAWGGVSCGGVPVTAMEWSCPAAIRTTLALRRSPSTRRGVRLR